ncbi:hypothetical protein DFH09DRAFT_1079329 [Mycena vulgaris]|nr:hypothetical protein DFH09DRAFT_1079329 [Mycena vulgaris]
MLPLVITPRPDSRRVVCVPQPSFNAGKQNLWENDPVDYVRISVDEYELRDARLGRDDLPLLPREHPHQDDLHAHSGLHQECPPFERAGTAAFWCPQHDRGAGPVRTSGPSLRGSTILISPSGSRLRSRPRKWSSCTIPSRRPSLPKSARSSKIPVPGVQLKLAEISTTDSYQQMVIGVSGEDWRVRVDVGAQLGSIDGISSSGPQNPCASDAPHAATALGNVDGTNPICSPKIRAPPTPNAPPPPSGALMGSIPSAPPKDLPHTPPLSPRASDAQRAATALGSTDGINPICSPKIRAPPTLNTPHAPDTCPLTQPRSARRIDEPRIRIRGGGSESEGYVRGGSISPDFAHGHGHGHAPMTAAELLRPQSSRPPLGGTTHSSDDHTPPASGARTNTHIDAANMLPPAGGHLSTAEAAHYAHA